MRILLVDLDLPTRTVLQSALRGHTIGIADTRNTALILQTLARSSQPIVTIFACHASGWWDCADLLNVIANNPTLATGHHFLMLTQLQETLPPILSHAVADLPICIIENGSDLGNVVATTVQNIGNSMEQQTTIPEPILFEWGNQSWLNG
jgi:hypothetical protein